MHATPHVFSIGPHTLLVRARNGREHVDSTGTTRWDTIVVTEAKKDPRDASPTGHHRGLMHFDIRVHSPHHGRFHEIHFGQVPQFPVNKSGFIPAIIAELHSSLPHAYAHPSSGALASLANRIRSYSIRPDLSSDAYPWIDLHHDEFEALVDHLGSRSLPAPAQARVRSLARRVRPAQPKKRSKQKPLPRKTRATKPAKSKPRRA